MKTIQSIEHLQCVIQGAYLALIDEHIIIEEEKNFGYDVYENPKGGFCVKTEFTDYYIEPIFKGDNMQPADDPEPHISEQIFFYHVGNKVSKVVKDFMKSWREFQMLIAQMKQSHAKK